ncbi:MAG: SUMF1/EgtB/PvdO family nonheme iron enzyme, partial [Candidatus Hydrogenedentes bacterium]|nr:SUMF1/EgtB/PvdO family nonheme iron enzyme [Candidatus Hydrogenedentota bacterium]
MKCRLLFVVSIAVAVAFNAAAASSAGEISAYGGHYYQFIYEDSGIYWSDAKTEAMSKFYLGMRGHLATITSAEENDFIMNSVLNPYPDNEQVLLGGFQPEGSSEPNGDWQWVTGEPFTYVNWNGSEPNEFVTGEDYLAIKNDGYWNDVVNTQVQPGMPFHYYVVEYELASGQVFYPERIYVPAGSFEMGDPWGEGLPDERPVHTVTLSEYRIGKYEVTNREYAAILNWALSTGRLTYTSGDVSAYGQTILELTSSECRISYNGDAFVVEDSDGYSMADHPVGTVHWYGAAVYCNWLSEKHGLNPCYDTNTWE